MTETMTKKPIAELLVAAKNGERDAQNALAMLHELGLVPGAQVSEAIQWYAQAAKAGDGLAALNLARIYEQGTGDAGADARHAEAYYQMAEKSGFRRAELRLEEAGIVGGRTILVVDDSPSIRSLTRELLRTHGFQVVEASDASQAIRYLQSGGQVDLIISDVDMPSMDGMEMLDVIRNRLKRRDLPVVIVTAVRKVEVLKRAKQLGVQGWVLKPFENNMLLVTVKKALAA